MTITASEREALEIVKRVTSRYAPNQMVIENFRCDVLRILLALAERADGEPTYTASERDNAGEHLAPIEQVSVPDVQSAREALERIKRVTEAFGPDEDIHFAASTWRQIRADMIDIAERAAGEPVAWKMVPVEPTAEMISAGIAAEISAPHIIDGKGWHATDFKAAVSLSYKAMLAAAPDAGENQ